MSFLQRYREYCHGVTDAPSVFHEYVGIATVATAMGNRWKMPHAGGWLYPNLWILLVAASSRYRKSTSLRLSQRITEELSKPVELAWRASEESLIEQLVKHPFGVTYCDEMASFAGMLGRDFMRGGRGLWATVYDGRLPAEHFKRGQSSTKHDLAVSFIAATTLEWLTDQMQESDIRGGLLPRFILIPAYKKERSMPRPPMGDEHVRKLLAGELERISLTDGLMTLSKDAEREYDRWYMQWDTAKLDGTRSDPWIPRIATAAMKIAMILQVDADGHRVIAGQTMREATQYATWALTQIGKLCREELAFSRFEVDLKRIREILQGEETEPTEGWMDYQELLWRSHIRTDGLRKIIQSGVESGQIEPRKVHRDGAKRLVEQFRWKIHRLGD